VGLIAFPSLIGALLWVDFRENKKQLGQDVILPNEQINRLVSEFQKLKALLPSIAIAITNGDHETERYAYALRDAFNRAGIQTEFGYTIPDGPDDTGVLICLKNPEHPPPEAEALSAALKQGRN
jgi:glutathionylspermidine synthase